VAERKALGVGHGHIRAGGFAAWIDKFAGEFMKRGWKGSAALKQYRGNWAGALAGDHRWAGPVAPWTYGLGSDQRRPADE